MYKINKDFQSTIKASNAHSCPGLK